jgi:BirA family transcriptional regulator, biotin operon repressor / biotin---[acetyl-CoA-carboxylase] ligase
VIAFAGGRLNPRRWRTFQNLTCLKETDSSNDLAREVIQLYFQEEQELSPSVFVAESQPGARGRRGHWVAPRGRGLYWTFVRRAEDGEPVSLIPVAVARWVRDALHAATRVRVKLKWPNDLYVGRRKLGGILTEALTQGEQTRVAVGVGLNVLGSAESLGVPQATTLEEEAGRRFALAPLLQKVLDRVDVELSRPRWDLEVGKWESVSLHRPGDRLTVRRDGEELMGEYLGLSPEGFLRLKTDSGEAVLASGEVSEW